MGFSSIEGVSFETQDALSVIVIENALATAKITPYGACVLSFIPKKSGSNDKGNPAGAQDLLWVSPTAVYNAKKPVRGGIPICWPWFGRHPLNSTMPAHGFVRNLVWNLEGIQNLASEATELVFSLEHSEATLVLWPYRFHLTLTVTVAETLSLRLTTTNLSDKKMVLTEAFHSYFKVQDVRNVSVLGLENSTQIDTLNAMRRCLQTELLTLSPPIDSVWINHSSHAVIEDKGLARCIEINKHGSDSTVVWNPGVKTVKGFQDIPNEQWPEFLCVESGNVFESTVTLLPNETHNLLLQIAQKTHK